MEELFSLAQPRIDTPALSAPGRSNGLAAAATASAQDTLGKDDFLKILLTQLTHQDPTQPMEDREFVAQMAQFSSLEQMTNLNDEMSRVAGMIGRNQALQLLGKMVEVRAGESVVAGRVDEVRGVEVPQLLVGGRYYDLQNVQTITEMPVAAASHVAAGEAR